MLEAQLGSLQKMQHFNISYFNIYSLNMKVETTLEESEALTST